MINKSDVCPLPFGHVEIKEETDGTLSYFPCCPGMIKFYRFNDYNGQSLEEAWNSERAKAFRAKLLSGDYSVCGENCCRKGLYERPAYVDYLYAQDLSFETICDYPKIITFKQDSECNLYCKTCRNELHRNTDEKLAELNSKIDTVYLPLLKKASAIYLTADGDPFASRHYRTLIKATAEKYPHIKFLFHTNGVLCNEKMLNELNVMDKTVAIGVSLHATKKETWQNIQRGGNWEVLNKNLEWISTLKRNGIIKEFYLFFVVSKLNYKEMPEAVKLAKKLGAKIRFSKYLPWGTDFDKDYNELAVFNPTSSKFLDYFCMVRKKIYDYEGCRFDITTTDYRNEKHPVIFISKILYKKFLKSISKIFKFIFSIRNSDNKTHKVVCILGIKIKIKRKNIIL